MCHSISFGWGQCRSIVDSMWITLSVDQNLYVSSSSWIGSRRQLEVVTEFRYDGMNLHSLHGHLGYGMDCDPHRKPRAPGGHRLSVCNHPDETDATELVGGRNDPAAPDPIDRSAGVSTAIDCHDDENGVMEVRRIVHDTSAEEGHGPAAAAVDCGDPHGSGRCWDDCFAGSGIDFRSSSIHDAGHAGATNGG